ncbi:uncharacterized protein ACRADG_000742 [Cochliomyia hominivorax]
MVTVYEVKRPQPKVSLSTNCEISQLMTFTDIMSLRKQVSLKLFNILISIKCIQSALLYPQYTVIQLVASISVPITDLPSDRKVSFDWGLQMNYDMPFNVSSFYMVPIWGTSKGSRNLYFDSRRIHEHDFTARQLYEGLENMLEGYGYNRSCLRRSICELSQHPFHEDYANIVTDVITFFLRPSINQGFSADEKSFETVYNIAENQGLFGHNCHQLYSECINSLINIISVIDRMKF